MAEANYLRERIIITHRDSMLAFLVEEGEPTETAFAWDHPQHRRYRERFREQLAHAQRFSEAMHGAQLLYNVMLAEAVENEEWIEWFRDALSEWAQLIARQQRALAGWDRGRFWAIVVEGGGRVRPPSRAFIETWLDLVLARGAAPRVGDLPDARRLISHREYELKGPRARLQNRQALLLWQGDAGSKQMGFRWGVTQDLVNDILEGLRADA